MGEWEKGFIIKVWQTIRSWGLLAGRDLVVATTSSSAIGELRLASSEGEMVGRSLSSRHICMAFEIS